MTNVFRLCFGDHKANRLYVKRRMQLAESSDAYASEAARNTALAEIADDDWWVGE
jgi:hypothetical protein